jgi:hypothetical protein
VTADLEARTRLAWWMIAVDSHSTRRSIEASESSVAVMNMDGVVVAAGVLIVGGGQAAVQIAVSLRALGWQAPSAERCAWNPSGTRLSEGRLRAVNAGV